MNECPKAAVCYWTHPQVADSGTSLAAIYAGFTLSKKQSQTNSGDPSRVGVGLEMLNDGMHCHMASAGCCHSLYLCQCSSTVSKPQFNNIESQSASVS